jgi:hypothetical protein
MVTKKVMGRILLATVFLAVVAVQAKEREIYIDTKIKPASKFEEARIRSVAVMNFDARDMETLGGRMVNYFVLSRTFSDEIIKKIFSLAKIDVALGQYEDSVVERDSVDKKKGDLYINSTSLERSVHYNCVPYKKIQAVLTGTINKYRPIGDGKGKSYIHITLKLTDNYDGTVYWVTDMEGYYKDVVHTIAYTLSTGKYEEPVEVIEQPAQPQQGKSKPKAEAAPAAAPADASAPAAPSAPAGQ